MNATSLLVFLAKLWRKMEAELRLVSGQVVLKVYKVTAV